MFFQTLMSLRINNNLNSRCTAFSCFVSDAGPTDLSKKYSVKQMGDSGLLEITFIS